MLSPPGWRPSFRMGGTGMSKTEPSASSSPLCYAIPWIVPLLCSAMAEPDLCAAARFDMLVVLIALLSEAFQNIPAVHLIRLLRIFRVIRLFRLLNSLNQIANALFASMVPVLN
eukprot:1062506-Rhodomonas_salina.1